MESGVQPRFGVFITMTVGLLLGFGLISQVGKYAENEKLLEAFGLAGADEEARELEEQRLRTVVLLGVPEDGEDRRNPSGDRPVRSVHGERGPQRRTPPSDPQPANPDRNRQPDPAPTPPQHRRERREPQRRFRTYVIRRNDTLYRIAEKYYGDGERWRWILQANPNLNPRRLPVNEAIRIPLSNAFNSAIRPDDADSSTL